MKYFDDTALVSHFDRFIDIHGKETSQGLTVNYDALDEIYKQQLASYFFERDDRNIFHFLESCEEEVGNKLIAVLSNPTVGNMAELAVLMCSELIIFYEIGVRNLLAERIAAAQQQEREEQGIKLRRHADNGEIYYTKL